MLRPLLLALFCSSTFTEQTGRVTEKSVPAPRLDYPIALSHSNAEVLCRRLGLHLREPRLEYLRDVLSKLSPNETRVSFYLPERHLSGSLCSILHTFAQNTTIKSFKTFGSCRLKRHFACGPQPRSGTNINPPLRHLDEKGQHGSDRVGNTSEVEVWSASGNRIPGDGGTHARRKGDDGADNDGNDTPDAVPTTDGGGEIEETVSTDSEATDSEITEDQSTATEQDATSDASAATETGTPDDRNDTDVIQWSGIRTATIVFAPVNALLLSLCLWAFCCTEFMTSVRTTLHLHLCALLCLGQLSLIISSCQCDAAVGAQLQFVYLGAVAFSALEGILLIHASFSYDAPSISLFYIVIGYSSSLIFAAAGFAKLGENYQQYEQLCVLNIETGAGWLNLAPVIAMIVINVSAVFVYELRISYLSENSASFPNHLKTRGRLIRSVGVTTFCLGLQWIFGAVIQRDTRAFSVLFFLLNLATSIAILVNHVACDREVRASMARVLGNRGKTAQRMADILRPRPPKVDGINQRVTYHSPPRVSDTLRSTLDRGIRPSIHLIRPLDHIPVST